MIQRILAIWSLVPLPFLNQLEHMKFNVHVLLNPGLENFEHYFTSMWDECNCAVVWAFLGIAFLRDWNENWPFPVLWPWPLLSFPNLQVSPKHKLLIRSSNSQYCRDKESTILLPGSYSLMRKTHLHELGKNTQGAQREVRKGFTEQMMQAKHTLQSVVPNSTGNKANVWSLPVPTFSRRGGTVISNLLDILLILNNRS